MASIKTNGGWDAKFSCQEGSQLPQAWRTGGKFNNQFLLNPGADCFTLFPA